MLAPATRDRLLGSVGSLSLIGSLPQLGDLQSDRPPALPSLPTGYAFVVDSNGAYVTSGGAYVIAEVA